MDSLKVRLLLATTAFSLISGALVGALLHYVLPQFYPDFFWGIVLFFFVIESFVIWYVASKAQKATSAKMVNLYMLAKVIKILVSLIFIVIYYASGGKENIKNFILVFIVFYGLYLFFETFLFSKIEKQLKNK